MAEAGFDYFIFSLSYRTFHNSTVTKSNLRPSAHCWRSISQSFTTFTDSKQKQKSHCFQMQPTPQIYSMLTSQFLPPYLRWHCFKSPSISSLEYSLSMCPLKQENRASRMNKWCSTAQSPQNRENLHQSNPNSLYYFGQPHYQWLLLDLHSRKIVL